MFFSVVVPLYNRPQELRELLDSLLLQTYKNFEVIIVEDGSSVRSDSLLPDYQHDLNLRYYYKENTGPGPTRNYGFAVAEGDYLVMFDSDCVIPPQYFEALKTEIEKRKLDAFGGPDRAHPSFSPLQKAMNYSMTSVLTTGGIRGQKTRVGKFHPRSFNMGFTPAVYQATGGFELARLGEDIDLSIRIISKGFKVELVENAYVYHKRKSTLKQFFKQVFNFGKTRIDLFLKHRNELKITHLFPAAYLCYLVSAMLLSIVSPQTGGLLALPIFIYWTAIFIHCALLERSVWVGFLSVITSNTQHIGYGSGFIYYFIKKILLRMR